ncbi:MAG: DUF2079 domain-containing protein [Patescibacteria group bacterium]
MKLGNKSRNLIILALACAIFVVAAVALGLGKLAAFRYNAIDLAYYNQALWNTIHGQPFALTIHPHPTLGDHFEPILLLLAPLYALAPGPKILIVLQALTLGGSAFLIFLLAKEILENPSARERCLPRPVVRSAPLRETDQAPWLRQLAEGWGSLGIALAWLANPFVWNIQLFEWHTLPFAIPPLLAALLFFERRRLLPFLGMLALALLVREDVALVVAGFGLYGLVRRRNIAWIAIPLAGGAAWFLFASRTIAHFAIGGAYKFLIYYGWLGNSFGEMAANMVRHPLSVLAHVGTLANVEMILGLLIPFLFVPLIAPQALVIAVFQLAQFMLLVAGGSSLIFETHYVSLFLPALFAAFIFGIRALPTLPRLGWVTKRHPVLIPLLLAVTTLYSAAALGPIPGTIQSLRLAKNDPLVSEAQRMIAAIPAEAGVAASYAFLPQLSSRQNFASLHYVFLGLTQFGAAPYALPQNIDYLLIDTADFLIYGLQFPKTAWTRDAYASAPARLRALIKERGFGIAEMSDSLVLFQRGIFPETLFEVYPHTNGLTEFNIGVRAGELKDLGPIMFLGTEPQDGDGLTFDLFLQTKETLTENYAVEFSVRAADGSLVYEKFHPLAGGLYPTSEWKPNEIVRSRYTLRVPDLPGKNYRIEARLVVLDGFLVQASDRGASPRFEIKKALPAFIISPKSNGR